MCSRAAVLAGTAAHILNRNYHMNKNNFLRLLKGAPLSILMALWVFGPQTRRQLTICTGWGRDVVGDALLLLESEQLIYRPHYRQWAITDGFYQLPLPFTQLSPGYLQLTDGAPAANAERRNNRLSDSEPAPTDNAERRENRLSAPERRDNRLSGPLVVSSSSTQEPKTQLPTTTPEGRENRLSESAHWLQRAGIVPNSAKWKALLALNLDPEYVQSHVLEMLANPEAINAGMLIYRLEHHWPAPASRCEQCLQPQTYCYCDIIRR